MKTKISLTVILLLSLCSLSIVDAQEQIVINLPDTVLLDANNQGLMYFDEGPKCLRETLSKMEHVLRIESNFCSGKHTFVWYTNELEFRQEVYVDTDLTPSEINWPEDTVIAVAHLDDGKWKDALDTLSIYRIEIVYDNPWVERLAIGLEACSYEDQWVDASHLEREWELINWCKDPGDVHFRQKHTQRISFVEK